MACQHYPDDQTQRLQEDDFIHLPSGPDRVACERQGEEEEEEADRLQIPLLLCDNELAFALALISY